MLTCERIEKIKRGGERGTELTSLKEIWPQERKRDDCTHRFLPERG